MGELTVSEMEAVQRALGIIEGVACGLPKDVSSMLTCAVEMIDEVFEVGEADG